MSDVRIMSPEEAKKASEAGYVGTGLPAAGFERDEELREREDVLQEAAEVVGEKRGIESIDPEKLKVDRDIQRAFEEGDFIDISGALENYEYCWVYFGLNGQWIWKKKKLMWEVVSGNMSEAREYMASDGTRRVGDVLLMRVKKEVKEALDAREEVVRKRRELGVEGELRELGDKHQGKGFQVHIGEDSTFASGRGMMEVMEKRAATKMGMQVVDEQLRKGDVPGMPGPKGR